MIALRDSIGSDFVKTTESFFSANGLLAKAKNFERRPPQQQMAAAVARALEEERHLVVEAGTGVGKSLADLVTGPEQNELEAISLWAARTRDGTLSDLSFEPNAKVWAQVCSEAHICTKKFCWQSDRCFYQRARRKFESAPIVVINHTLLF